ncbi:MAG: translation initiation factor [Acidobacteria bacterium]|nr:translation initiation factor [Acidobacteriota bacterium]
MADDRVPFHNPFASLARLRGDPAADPPPAAAEPGLPEPSVNRLVVPRAVVRMERAGRRGKEVTVIEHLGLPADELAQWLKALKSALGCGGAVEPPAIVLQGDQRTRVPALLTARGVKRVTVS